MGRGLFSTKDVEPGELLFVSNSLLSVTFKVGGGGDKAQSRARDSVLNFECKTFPVCNDSFSIYRPLEERRSPVNDMRCKCDRCSLEERLLKRVPALAKLHEQCEELWEHREILTSINQDAVKTRCMFALSSLSSLLKEHPELSSLTRE